jgi:hypothetical protein
MKLLNKIIAAGLTLACAGTALAALTPDEIKQLGTTLTPIGAEKAGNADGSIPAYTGGLTSSPKGYVKGAGLRVDPFADEKPLFSIDAKNMAQYSGKLTEGAKAMMKKYPGYRVDVYKSHRTVAFPKFVSENTIKNAGKANVSSDGMTIKAPQAGYPFPIPKNGVEAMWNHQVKFNATTKETSRSYTVDASGRAVMASELLVTQEYPFWISPMNYDYFYRLKIDFTGPARRAGEAMMIHEALNISEHPRRAWQYLPGQRRVKMAPELGWDTPDPSTSGATTMDDNFMYNGPMDRFSFKLVGKKEMYVPYNDYKLAYHSKAADVLKPNFVNPDYVRWELHRVWVVEATLKPGKRHIYAKRLFYLDEDSWQALASDQYDARGQLYRSGFTYIVQLYDYPAPVFEPFGHYDLISGQYNLNAYTAETGGKHFIAPPPERSWSADSLAGSGVR